MCRIHAVLSRCVSVRRTAPSDFSHKYSRRYDEPHGNFGTALASFNGAIVQSLARCARSKQVCFCNAVKSTYVLHQITLLLLFRFVKHFCL